MQAEQIVTEPFKFIEIIDCQLKKEVSQHGHAYVKGYIEQEKEEEYMMMACDQTQVTLTAIGEDAEEKLIYSGILKDLKIWRQNRVCVMELEITPYTCLLGLKPRIRSFQAPDMTYDDVLSCVLSQYEGGDAIMNIGSGMTIKEPIVQYQETDWEFIKRLASHFNSIVMPSYDTIGPKLYFGLLEWPGTTVLNPICYRAQKNVSEYLYKEQNQVEGLIEDDSLLYIVDTEELHEIGEKVEFRGLPYYIAKMDGSLDGHQVRNTYYLKPEAGFQIPKQYNEKIIGASLDGTVLGVRADVVQVHLRMDAKEGVGKWFQFSTVYSSPNGSGWYCMPEPGDEIRLYFPTEKEKHAYVISSVHLPVQKTRASVSPGVARTDPTHKTISTVFGKTVDLWEKGIRLDAGNGMSIELIDGTGISITSPSGVSIKSDSSIDISSLSGKVEVAGATNASILQNGNKVEVASDNVTFSGAKAKVQ